MYFRSTACATLAVVFALSASGIVAVATDEVKRKHEPVGSLACAGSPNELAERLDSLLSNCGKRDLDRLVTSSDCSAAIAAGWERVRRTMPETEGDPVSPDTMAVSRFVGLVEGRLRAPVPKAWEESLKSAMGCSQKRVWFPPRVDLKLMVALSAEDWSVEQDGAQWLVKGKSETIRLPARHSDVPGVVAERTDEQIYVALSNYDGHSLFAVERASGKMIWSSDVFGKSQVKPRGSVIVGRTGNDWHVVSMRVTGELVVVLGFSSQAVYFEAFDRLSGAVQCRFSTAYFDFVEPNR